ncbi:MAG: hypothetical protein HYV63_02390 [Candidatus Schekmanbacteria bacterium]|nr:hypothetical protein [Candidatus Schekmanbacteria bacterium]
MNTPVEISGPPEWRTKTCRFLLMTKAHQDHAGREKPGDRDNTARLSLRELVSMIHAVNPTEDSTIPAAERAARYLRKDALQLELMRRFPEDLRIEHDGSDEVVLLALKEPVEGWRDACHLPLDRISVDTLDVYISILEASREQQSHFQNQAPPPRRESDDAPVDSTQDRAEKMVEQARRLIAAYADDEAERLLRSASALLPDDPEPRRRLLALWRERGRMDKTAEVAEICSVLPKLCAAGEGGGPGARALAADCRATFQQLVHFFLSSPEALRADDSRALLRAATSLAAAGEMGAADLRAMEALLLRDHRKIAGYLESARQGIEREDWEMAASAIESAEAHWPAAWEQLFGSSRRAPALAELHKKLDAGRRRSVRSRDRRRALLDNLRAVLLERGDPGCVAELMTAAQVEAEEKSSWAKDVLGQLVASGARRLAEGADDIELAALEKHFLRLTEAVLPLAADAPLAFRLAELLRDLRGARAQSRAALMERQGHAALSEEDVLSALGSLSRLEAECSDPQLPETAAGPVALAAARLERAIESRIEAWCNNGLPGSRAAWAATRSLRMLEARAPRSDPATLDQLPPQLVRFWVQFLDCEAARTGPEATLLLGEAALRGLADAGIQGETLDPIGNQLMALRRQLALQWLDQAHARIAVDPGSAQVLLANASRMAPQDLASQVAEALSAATVRQELDARLDRVEQACRVSDFRQAVTLIREVSTASLPADQAQRLSRLSAIVRHVLGAQLRSAQTRLENDRSPTLQPDAHRSRATRARFAAQACSLLAALPAAVEGTNNWPTGTELARRAVQFAGVAALNDGMASFFNGHSRGAERLLKSGLVDAAGRGGEAATCLQAVISMLREKALAERRVGPLAEAWLAYLCRLRRVDKQRWRPLAVQLARDALLYRSMLTLTAPNHSPVDPVPIDWLRLALNEDWRGPRRFLEILGRYGKSGWTHVPLADPCPDGPLRRHQVRELVWLSERFSLPAVLLDTTVCGPDTEPRGSWTGLDAGYRRWVLSVSAWWLGSITQAMAIAGDFSHDFLREAAARTCVVAGGSAWAASRLAAHAVQMSSPGLRTALPGDLAASFGAHLRVTEVSPEPLLSDVEWQSWTAVDQLACFFSNPCDWTRPSFGAAAESVIRGARRALGYRSAVPAEADRSEPARQLRSVFLTALNGALWARQVLGTLAQTGLLADELAGAALRRCTACERWLLEQCPQPGMRAV